MSKRRAWFLCGMFVVLFWRGVAALACDEIDYSVDNCWLTKESCK